MTNFLLGTDIGGTFTDVILTSEDRTISESVKVLTTPADPVAGVLTGVREILACSNIGAGQISRSVHATTLATNLILEQRGAKVAYITTQGFGDLPIIGRDVRAGNARYDLYFEKPKPPIYPIIEVSERISARGEVLIPLDERRITEMVDILAGHDVSAVAICLLNSYANATHETALEDMIRTRLPHLHVVRSTRVWPQIREFDRAMTTIMSAYVAPVLGQYLGRLEEGLRQIGITAALQFMMSNGGILGAGRAADYAIYAVESGPAAAIVAAGAVGRQCGETDIIAFDMGGTTAKAGLVRNGEPTTTNEFYVGGSTSVSSHDSGGFPVQIPVIDLAEVGSGGGSIAWIDEGGALKVGPHSAGAQPGPACYPNGGDAPTVTDADLLLGYLDPDYFAGGTISISAARALDAIAVLAKRLSLEPLAVAIGIHDIANSNMASAIRRITVEKGIDPRNFTAIASGGAGPVHIARVASEFSIARIIVPHHAGVGSALGLIASDITLDRVRSYVSAASSADLGLINGAFEELERSAREEIEPYKLPPKQVHVQRTIEMRYRHQAHGLAVPIANDEIAAASLASITGRFYELYNERFGIHTEDETEVVSLKLRLVGKVSQVEAPIHQQISGDGSAAIVGQRRAYFHEHNAFVDTPIYDARMLRSGEGFHGPALIQDPDSTIIIPPDYMVLVDSHYNIIIELDKIK